ncbi:class I SAM-dependent methyltransferase, partial [Escherichia coli]|uniref:class I SAM-dependent methyltransferase n=1 Tax=Escherichia coli TaxID=562 RepID=UPI001275246A
MGAGTAGVGGDALVRGSVGWRVRVRERNGGVGGVLDDGLGRGYAEGEIGGWWQERWQLI